MGGGAYSRGVLIKNLEFSLFVKTFFNIIVRHKNKNTEKKEEFFLKRKEKYKLFEMKFESANDYKKKALFN